LKTKVIGNRAVAFFKNPATRAHNFSLSITHGPAISTSRRLSSINFQIAPSLNTRDS
jgi:hypothetical protein